MTKSDYENMVDELGLICAQEAELERRAKTIKAKLIASGKPAIDGKLYRATVSKYTQARLDMDAVRAKLSAQFMNAHTNETEVTKVLVKALSPALVVP